MQNQERQHGESSLSNVIHPVAFRPAPVDDKCIDSAGNKSFRDRRGDWRRERRSFCMGLGEIAGIRCNTTANRALMEGDAYGSSTILNRLYEAQEEAGRRVAQRLHDDSAQMLATVYFELARISQDCPAETAEKINGVVKCLDEVCEQLRRLSHEIRPPILDQLGLVPALRFLADGLGRRSGLEIVVRDSTVDIPPPIQFVLYRVVQEALSNVARHAWAAKAEVSLWVEQGSVHCIVSDDGVGFTMPENGSAAVPGLGLAGIYERVSALGGDCTIASCRRRGTQFTELQVVIPL